MNLTFSMIFFEKQFIIKICMMPYSAREADDRIDVYDQGEVKAIAPVFKYKY